MFFFIQLSSTFFLFFYFVLFFPCLVGSFSFSNGITFIDSYLESFICIYLYNKKFPDIISRLISFQ